MGASNIICRQFIHLADMLTANPSFAILHAIPIMTPDNAIRPEAHLSMRQRRDLLSLSPLPASKTIYTTSWQFPSFVHQPLFGLLDQISERNFLQPYHSIFPQSIFLASADLLLKGSFFSLYPILLHAPNSE